MQLRLARPSAHDHGAGLDSGHRPPGRRGRTRRDGLARPAPGRRRHQLTSSPSVAGRIVVGVDGSDGSLAALRWALAEAELRQAEVEAVFAWSYPYVGELTGMSMSMVDRDELEADAKAVIAQAAAKLPADEIRAPLHEVIAEGSAAQVLTDLAQGADLLVVSSRGRGGLKGLLLGSVSQQVAH